MNSNQSGYFSNRGNNDRFIQPLPFDIFDLKTNQEESNYKPNSYDKYLKNQMFYFSQAEIKRNQQKIFINYLPEPLTYFRHALKEIHSDIQIKKQYRKISAPSIANNFCYNIMDWSLDNTIILGTQKKLYIWTTPKDKSKIIVFKPSQSEFCSIKVNNNEIVSIGDRQGKIKFLDLRKQIIDKQRIKHFDRVGCLDWHQNLLVSGSRDGSVVGWDKRIKQSIFSYKKHEKQVTSVKWNKQGNIIASGGYESNIILRDIRFFDENMAQFSHLYKGPIKGMDWCPSNPSILATSGGPIDRQINFLSSKYFNISYKLETDSQVHHLIFSKTNNQLISTHGKPFNQIKLWKSNDNWKIKQSVKNTLIMHGHQKRATSIAFNPAGDIIATLSLDNTIRFWRPFEGKQFQQNSELNASDLR